MIVDQESYDVTATVPSIASQLSKLKSKGADTLFIFATPSFTIGALAIVTGLTGRP